MRLEGQFAKTTGGRKATNEVSATLSMHAARTAMNRDPDLRAWVEEWLKNKERAAHSEMSEEEFERHWKYVRPERMHEGATEAVAAYRQRNEAR